MSFIYWIVTVPWRLHWGMLQMLQGLCRFCIMTATLSDGFYEEYQGWNYRKKVLKSKIVTLDKFDDDKGKIGSLQIPAGKPSKKEIEVAEGKIDAGKIKKHHLDKTIVICNRVETAQRIYLELEDWAKQNKVKLLCLHSRFFDKHRKFIEGQLRGLFW